MHWRPFRDLPRSWSCCWQVYHQNTPWGIWASCQYITVWCKSQCHTLWALRAPSNAEPGSRRNGEHYWTSAMITMVLFWRIVLWSSILCIIVQHFFSCDLRWATLLCCLSWVRYICYQASSAISRLLNYSSTILIKGAKFVMQQYPWPASISQMWLYTTVCFLYLFWYSQTIWYCYYVVAVSEAQAFL